MPYLEYFKDLVTHHYPIKSKSVTVGRCFGCCLNFERDVKMSRAHFTIREAPGEKGFILRDHDSTNGTLVNGHRVGIAPVPLQDGDVITAGQTMMTFRENLNWSNQWKSGEDSSGDAPPTRTYRFSKDKGTIYIDVG